MTNLMIPVDEPEGVAQVLMSVTVFMQWVEEHPDVEVVEWGSLEPWSGLVYTPSLRKRMHPAVAATLSDATSAERGQADAERYAVATPLDDPSEWQRDEAAEREWKR